MDRGLFHEVAGSRMMVARRANPRMLMWRAADPAVSNELGRGDPRPKQLLDRRRRLAKLHRRLAAPNTQLA